MSPTSVVDRWFDAVADPDLPLSAYAALLDPDVRFVERPNLVNPHGTDRDREAMLQGVATGRGLLAWQRFDQRQHDVVGADRVITRTRWQGEVARAAGPLAAGQVLTAHIAAFITLRDGRILRQENYDCYQPL